MKKEYEISIDIPTGCKLVERRTDDNTVVVVYEDINGNRIIRSSVFVENILGNWIE